MFGFFKGKEKEESTPLSDTHKKDVWYAACPDCSLSGLTETAKEQELEECPRCESKDIYRRKM